MFKHVNFRTLIHRCTFCWKETVITKNLCSKAKPAEIKMMGSVNMATSRIPWPIVAVKVVVPGANPGNIRVMTSKCPRLSATGDTANKAQTVRSTAILIQPLVGREIVIPIKHPLNDIQMSVESIRAMLCCTHLWRRSGFQLGPVWDPGLP